uniref:Uncharacterized protein n=1 Tax=Rhizophora mucronata TaxID=61149 RepID=A0A2P2Q8C2_RHIMU
MHQTYSTFSLIRHY